MQRVCGWALGVLTGNSQVDEGRHDVVAAAADINVRERGIDDDLAAMLDAGEWRFDHGVVAVAVSVAVVPVPRVFLAVVAIMDQYNRRTGAMGGVTGHGLRLECAAAEGKSTDGQSH